MKNRPTRYVLTDELYKLIKHQILSHQLPSGERINIDQLARMWQVSNIPIREALSRLASEGLVDAVPFKGTFVSHISRRELRSIFEVRQLLESYAVKKAIPSIPSSEFQMVEKRMQQLSNPTLTSAIEFSDWIDSINNSVHGIVLKYCDNDVLATTVNEHIARIQRYLNYVAMFTQTDFSELEWREHYDILTALKSRDAIAAVQAMDTHLKNACERTIIFFD